MQSNAGLARASRSELAPSSSGIEEWRPLDVYAGGLSDEAPRLSWLATITAGELVEARNGQRVPRATKQTDERWIHLRPGDEERAPGLVRALEEGGWRKLTIAFPINDVRQVVQQHFEQRTARELVVHGDEHQLTEIVHINTGKKDDNGHPIFRHEHRRHEAGTEEYRRLVERCKVSVDVFFTLARWVKGRDGRWRSEMYFPDGMGWYRLNYTSRNSLREQGALLRQVASMTGGSIAGIPFELTLDFREVTDPSAARRTIPVWRPLFAPPFELTVESWRETAGQALRDAAALSLPAPRTLGIEEAEADQPEPDLDDPRSADVEVLERGGLCDRDLWTKRWFATVRGSALDSDDARAALLREFTDGATESLAEYLGQATEEEANNLILRAVDLVVRERSNPLGRRYEEVFGDEDGEPVRAAPTEEPAPAEDVTDLEELAEAEAAFEAAEAPDEPRHLVDHLRKVPSLGEVFTCQACGAEYGAARTKSGVVPARLWLEDLERRGYAEPLCVSCARAVAHQQPLPPEAAG